MSSAPAYILKTLHQSRAVLFSKAVCPECIKVKSMLYSTRVLTPDTLHVVEIEKRGDCSQIQSFLWDRTDLNTQTVPLLFLNGVYFGGYDRILGLFQEKRLTKALVAMFHERELKRAAMEAAKLEEVVVCLRVLDTLEIRVELRALGEVVDFEDGEESCKGPRFGFDPWDTDECDLIEVKPSTET